MDKASRDRLANKVKRLRGDRSQGVFASLLDVSQASIAGWENSKNIPTIENIERLAELSNQLPEEFLAEVYGRKISTTEIPPIAFAITNMGNEEIGGVLMLIAQKIAATG